MSIVRGLPCGDFTNTNGRQPPLIFSGVPPSAARQRTRISWSGVVDAESAHKNDGNSTISFNTATKSPHLRSSGATEAATAWCAAADYWDVKFDLTKGIKEAFDKDGISIPYPHSVEIQKAG